MNKKHIFSKLFLLFMLVAVTASSFLISGVLPNHQSVFASDVIEKQGGGTTVSAAVTYSEKGIVSSADYKDLKLYPGGVAFGVKFQTDGLIVTGFVDVVCEGGRSNPAYDAGIRAKDVIVKINGRPAQSISQLTEAVETSNGKSITVALRRSGRELTVNVTPKYSKAEGRYKTGLLIKDSGAGIGTITYIDPSDLSFGGLGHGICDGGTGELVPMLKGNVLGVNISGIVKGEAGAPGEIKGYFNSERSGVITKNSVCGVYGNLAKLPKGLQSPPLSVASREEMCEGEAYIYCTLDDSGPHRYSISISAINKQANGNKCFTVKVTDKDLIAKTGGIVQGMSGSPIIQNGKLVGAVTHVLINDPTTGYGIFIENMLNAAQMPMAKAS
jgi:stage IV sporulation protein B